MKTKLEICVDCYFEFKGWENILMPKNKENLIKKNVKILKELYSDGVKIGKNSIEGRLIYSTLRCDCCQKYVFGVRYFLTLDNEKYKRYNMRVNKKEI